MSSGRTGRFVLLLLTYLTLAILFTYPLAWHLGTHHVGEDGGDARVYVWNYWWIDKAITELHTDPFETDAIFYPLGIGLALHTLGFAQGLVFIPLKAAFGAVAGPFLGVWMSLVAADKAAVGVAQTLCSLTPVFILPFAVMIHKERVSPRAALGAVIAVAGVVLLFFNPTQN